MNIYVGNLDIEVTEDEIRNLFAPFGEISKATITRNRHGISKGFGFIEMPSDDQANSAIKGLHRKLLYDRTLDISESLPMNRKGGHSRAKSRHIRFKR